jgi:hypothetical protein
MEIFVKPDSKREPKPEIFELDIKREPTALCEQ